MAQYIALHTLKTSPEAFSEFFNGVAAEFGQATVSGATPAKCIKTWNPIPHGRTEYVFCLWEADSTEDIAASLGEVLEYVTLDAWQVDEVDWEQVAQAVG